MVRCEVPFGSSKIGFDLPKGWEILKSAAPKPASKVPDEEKEIKMSIERPIGSKRLSELVTRNKKIAIIVDDISRPTPISKIMPKLLDELLGAGANTEKMFVIFGCAIHRKLEALDMEARLGRNIIPRIRAINSDLQNDLIELGKTSFGTPIAVNREYYEADLKIALGTIEPHVFAGFGGGHKAVLPGITGINTIMSNHKLVTKPRSQIGVSPEENPVRKDLEEAGKICGLDFIVNTVLNDKKEIVKVVAGDPILAHREGVKVASEIYGVDVPARADIVITSAFPLDIDIRQSGKSIINTMQATKENGTILCISPCPEGAGTVTLPKPIMKSEDFIKFVRGLKDADVAKLIETLNVPIEEWCNSYLWVSVLRSNNVVLSSPGVTDQQAGSMYIRNYPKISDAIAQVRDIVGNKAGVLIFPVGGITFPIFPKESSSMG
ncbi:MAG: nickel-dependent lactate racemase [Candidatus Atabeyarchaeum deiterrae]